MENATKKNRKESPSAEPKNGPVRIIRLNDVSASIWAREVSVKGVPKTFHSVTFERSYKLDDSAYKYTRSFDPQSLPRLVEVIRQTEATLKELHPA